MPAVHSAGYLLSLLLFQPLEPEREEKGNMKCASGVLRTPKVPALALHPGHPGSLAILKAPNPFGPTLFLPQQAA